MQQQQQRQLMLQNYHRRQSGCFKNTTPEGAMHLNWFLETNVIKNLERHSSPRLRRRAALSHLSLQ
jgi:hypothetical protein